MRRYVTGRVAGDVELKARLPRACLSAMAMFAAVFLVLCCFQRVALAAETRLTEPFSPLNGTASGVTIANPGGIAIDEATGNVFLNDGSGTAANPNGTAKILGGANGAPVGLLPPHLLTGFVFPLTNNGVAYDNSTSSAKGTLYVAVAGGKIKKFIRNPVSERYEAAGELVATPPAGRSFGTAGNAGLAVDLVGNLFMAETTCQCIVKFSPAGTQTVAYDVGSSVGAPNSVAINADGDVFAVRSAQGGVFVYPADGSGEIDPANFTVLVAPASNAASVAVDPARNKLYIAFRSGPARVAQYDATTLQSEFEFGVGTLTTSARVAVNSVTNRVYVSDTGAGKKNVAVFAPPITLPSATTKAASDITGTTATLNGTVNPKGNAITECKFEYGTTTTYGKSVPCKETVPTDSNDHAVSADISGLTPNGATYHFRLWVNSVAGEAAPQGSDRTFVTANTVFTEPATAVGATTATVHGLVKPEGAQLIQCFFEYGLSESYGESAPCVPAAGAIPDDFGSHAVSAALTGLEENAVYHFRLVATNAHGTASGADLTFTTQGPPAIVEQLPLDVERTGATLRAKLNPFGSPTTYHFEWGEDSSYGNRIPADHELFAGSGFEPVTVAALIDDLEEESVYHFRVIATNSFGTTTGPDRELSTLNQDGLAWGRRYELVSPLAKGPVGQAGDGQSVGGGELPAQASPDGGAIHYVVGFGLENASAAGEVVYRSDRGPDGWQLTSQISPSLEGAEPSTEEGISSSRGSFNRWLARDLECAFSVSALRLTEDPVAQVMIEAGGHNLYRRNPDGSYELVSNLVPTNPEDADAGTTSAYQIIGASQDCERIIFETQLRYPGIPLSDTTPDAIADLGLYEWKDGVLANPATIPSSSGPAVPAVASAGAGSIESQRNDWNALSEDGSRFYFTAISQLGGDAGNEALFLSEEGEATIDVSQSQTVTPNNDDIRYQMATPDGAHVFFIGRDGLADNDTAPDSTDCVLNDLGNDHAVGCELYRYSVDDEELTDLSPGSTPANPQGASVAGVLDASADGSRVYFAARGQLVPHEGQSFAENTSVGTRGYNLYLWDSGNLSYVATIAQSDVNGGNKSYVLASSTQARLWASRATPSGGHLVFQSTANITGYDSGGEPVAYRYSAASGKTECVSCRPDGQPSLGSGRDVLLPAHRSMPSISDDGHTVFFQTLDRLAPGAVNLGPNDLNLYEWREGQVSLLAAPPVEGSWPEFRTAVEDGSSVFFKTREALVPWDSDGGVSDLYVARTGGGFPPPPQPPQPCDPLSEGSCAQGSGAPGSPAAPASSTFSGQGNARGTRPKCRKGKVRRKGKCVSKRKAKRHNRAGRNDRRAGK